MNFSLPLPEIRHDKAGFEALVCLHGQAKDCFFDNIDVDMSATSWFDADMCAAFGAILYRLSKNLNTVKLTNVEKNVVSILSKNGFMSSYGREKIPDRWGTTIPYQRFDVKDDRYFAGYIENKFMQRSEIPVMSPGLQKKFREGIFEIFSNAVLHSQTEMGIFSCGQFFPKRDRLDFSVADLGIGIRRNVKENAGLDLAPEDAIIWATEGCNTTKRGQIPGGLGLKLLCQFIDLNEGCIQIVSDAGYWKREKRKTFTARLSQPFPGTVVSVEINTADKQSYALTYELSETDIF
ncbi:MAG: sensor histidine kinase [Deltaproteobacteria bacterium]|nr:sensor histidine kinase [Deltaproteobacteria bacterium]